MVRFHVQPLMTTLDKTMMQIFDLIELADQKMCILVTDRQLELPGPHILYANKRWQEVTGYLLEEVAGKTPRILQGEQSDRTQLAQLKAALKRGDKFVGTTVNYRKDGKPFQIAWVVVAPVNDGYYVALQKVVEVNDAMEQLKQIENIQKNILKKLNEVLPLDVLKQPS